MVPRFVRRVSRVEFSHAVASLMAIGLSCSQAATWTWDGVTGNWSAGANWNINTVPLSAVDTALIFGGNATGYSATHDLASPFDLNAITLESAASSPVVLTGNPLRFLANVGVNPIITQNGIGDVVFDLPLVSAVPLTFVGAGLGIVQLNGVISGTGASSSMNFTGGHWQIRNPLNTFEGGLNIGTGSTVEVLPLTGPTNVVRGPASYLGSNALLPNPGITTIQGGTLKLTTQNPTNSAGMGGHIALGTGFPLTFGTNGGTLDLRNSNPSAPGVHSGTIGYHDGVAVQGGGSLALTLNNTAPAVIQFNGGELGLSSLTAPNSGDWELGGNTLRIREYIGTGPVRFELTNGALSRAATGGNGIYAVNVPLTYRGVQGGDPTSGALGNENSGRSLTTGRVVFDRSRLDNASTLVFEDALQVIAANGAAGINGNVRLAGVMGGHPAVVTFSGRVTGSQMGSTIAPTTGAGVAQHVFWVGDPAGGTDNFTIEEGATGIFDARIRMDQNIHHGVILDARAVLEGGGTLRVAQSLSNFSPIPGIVALANVGDIILRGPIEGQGNTANDAVLDLRLPAPDAAGTIGTGVPKPITNAALGNNERPFGGLVAETGHQIIINGTGFGGLRVEANARPDALFSTTGAAGGTSMPDPTSNLTKLNGYLTAPRLAGITGTSGYLTAVPTGQTWQFPAGGEWANAVPVGLRVTNHQPTGVDVSFGNLTSFQHYVAVDAGATLDVGTAPFTYGPATATAGIGTLHGSGTVVASGGLTVAAGGRLAPGMGAIGTLTVETNQLSLQGRLEVDANAMAADLLKVVGDLVLGATSQLVVPGTTVLAPRGYKIAEANHRTGTFNGAVGLPANFAVDYSRPDEVWLKYTGARQLTWTGNATNHWDQVAQNWSGPTAFLDTDDVLFDDTAAVAKRTVTLTGGNVSPNETTVNTSGTYSLISSPGAAIVGYGELIKDGPGTLVLSGPAAFEGGLTINAGEVETAAPNSIPDIGKVRVAAGAQLNLTGVETIEHLVVGGSVTSTAALTVGALKLQDATAFSASLVLQGNVTKSGGPLTLPQPIDLAGATRAFHVESGTAPELTLGGVVTNGGIQKTGPGMLALNALNPFTGGLEIQAGVVRTDVSGALSENNPVTVRAGGVLNLNGESQLIGALESNGAIQLGGATLTAASLQGVGGTIDLGNGSLTVAQATSTRYDGVISGVGSVTKSGIGSLGLGGANTFAGGLNVLEGSLRILNNQAPGPGTITVGSGGAVVLEATVGVPIALNGGTLSSRFVGQVSVSIADVTANTGTTSMILLADADDSTVRSPIIFDGTLRGSGDLLVQAAPDGTKPDDNPGFRLLGNGASDFSGVITMTNRVKVELKTEVAGPFSPMGTGSIVMSAGSFGGSRSGTYSQLNLRNNTAGDTIIGNDVVVSGAGLVNFGPASTGELAPADSRIVMGNLRIGGGQIAGVNKNGGNSQIVQFATVTLTGGDATFSPKTPAFGFGASSDLALGPISELAPGSGIIMDGEANLFLLGGNTYTGTTRIQRGTTWLAGAGALPATSALHVDAGATVDFQNRSGVSFSQTVGALSGTGLGFITNTATGAARDFVINQASDTIFEGAITGNLNVVKQGVGTLQLVGANTYTGTTTVAGGTLSVSSTFLQGSITGAVIVQSGASLTGYGSVGNLTVAGGGRVAPGNSAGILTTGAVTLQHDAVLEFELNGTVEGSQYDQVQAFGLVTLDGLVPLVLDLGFDPTDHLDTFTLILNNDLGPIGGAGRFVYGADVLENGDQFEVTNAFFSQLFEIRYNGGNDNNDVVLLAVPEPSSVLLMLGGLGVLARRRRRG